MKEKMTRMRAEEMKRRFQKRDERIFEKVEAKRKMIAERRTKDSSKQKLLKSKQKMARVYKFLTTCIHFLARFY